MAPKKKATSSTTRSLTELKSLNRAELMTELATARRDLYALQMKKELSELKQTHLLKKGRKHIAILSTLLATTL
jgi:ribosomal protein L29